MLEVYTGDGKGKTTAAIGTAFRAAGVGFKVKMIQFIKGSWDYGELHSADKLGDRHMAVAELPGQSFELVGIHTLYRNVGRQGRQPIRATARIQ